jgi:hypothetical protein
MAFSDRKPYGCLEIGIVTLILGVLISPLAKCAGREAAELKSQSDATVPENLGVRTMVSTQTSHGFTEERLNEAWLDEFAGYSEGRIATLATPKWDEMGVPQAQRTVKAEPVIVDVSGRKLGVIRFRIDQVTPMAMIVGFQNGEFLRVVCINDSAGDVPVLTGACGAKLSEVFNIKLDSGAQDAK